MPIAAAAMEFWTKEYPVLGVLYSLGASVDYMDMKMSCRTGQSMMRLEFRPIQRVVDGIGYAQVFSEASP